VTSLGGERKNFIANQSADNFAMFPLQLVSRPSCRRHAGKPAFGGKPDHSAQPAPTVLIDSGYREYLALSSLSYVQFCLQWNEQKKSTIEATFFFVTMKCSNFEDVGFRFGTYIMV